MLIEQMLHTLPVVIAYEICTYLSIIEIRSLRTVASWYHHLVRSVKVWRHRITELGLNYLTRSPHFSVKDVVCLTQLGHDRYAHFCAMLTLLEEKCAWVKEGAVVPLGENDPVPTQVIVTSAELCPHSPEVGISIYFLPRFLSYRNNLKRSPTSVNYDAYPTQVRVSCYVQYCAQENYLRVVIQIWQSEQGIAQTKVYLHSLQELREYLTRCHDEAVAVGDVYSYRRSK